MKKAWLFILVLLWPLVSVGQTGADRLASKGVEGAIVGAVFGGLAGLIGGIIYIAKRAKRAAEPKMREIASKSKTAIGNMSKSKEEKLLAIDDEFFSAASDEILQGTQVKGLWAKALALADGDEKKQKAIYVRLRAKQMDDVHERQAGSRQAGKAEHIVDQVEILEKQEISRLEEQRTLDSKIERSKAKETVWAVIYLVGVIIFMMIVF